MEDVLLLVPAFLLVLNHCRRLSGQKIALRALGNGSGLKIGYGAQIISSHRYNSLCQHIVLGRFLLLNRGTTTLLVILDRFPKST